MRISPHVRIFDPPAAAAPNLVPSTELQIREIFPGYWRSRGIVTPQPADGGSIDPDPKAHGTQPVDAAVSGAWSSAAPDSDTDRPVDRIHLHRPRWWSALSSSGVSGPGCGPLGTAIRAGESPAVLDADARKAQGMSPAPLLPHPPQSNRWIPDSAADCSGIVRNDRAPPVQACLLLRIDHRAQPR